MINEAIKKYKLNKKECFMVGDKKSDLMAAKMLILAVFYLMEVIYHIKLKKF